jgi:hypothetical protein
VHAIEQVNSTGIMSFPLQNRFVNDVAWHTFLSFTYLKPPSFLQSGQTGHQVSLDKLLRKCAPPPSSNLTP